MPETPIDEYRNLDRDEREVRATTGTRQGPVNAKSQSISMNERAKRQLTRSVTPRRRPHSSRSAALDASGLVVGVARLVRWNAIIGPLELGDIPPQE